MDKRSIIAISLALLVVAVSYFAIATKEDSRDSQNLNTLEITDEKIVYKFTEDSQIIYSAQKKFFKKPTETVVGVNKNLNGGIIEKDGGLAVSVSAELKDFVTSSPKRDQDIANLIKSNIVITSDSLSAQFDGLDSGKFEGTIPLTVTVNNTPQIVNFEVVAEKTETGAKVTGKGQLKITGFGLKAPSLLEVYEVDDVLGVEFAVELIK